MKTPTALADFVLEMYEDEDARLSSFEARVRLALTGKISAAEAKLIMLKNRIRNSFSMKLTTMEAILKVLEARVSAADPRKILERGYALALDGNGVVMKSVKGRAKGDRVSMMFADGRLDCIVDEVKQ